MPKFIGRTIPGATEIAANAGEIRGERVRLSYAQAIRLPASAIMCSLDTTDRGGKRSLAKRWYRWFASPAAICASSAATPLMLVAAGEIPTSRIDCSEPDHIDCAACLEISIDCARRRRLALASAA